MGLRVNGENKIWDIEYSKNPYGHKLQEIKKEIESLDLLVGFNLKFDIQWLLRYIPDLEIQEAYDCQLVQFLIWNQTRPYPSLDDSLSHFGLDLKLDVVANEYWDNGIDTPDIPIEILEEYLKQDLQQTEKLYEAQSKLKIEDNRKNLIKLHNEDMLLLCSMETQGLLYNFAKAESFRFEIERDSKQIIDELNNLFNTTDVNWFSPEQVSIVLFGGKLKVKGKVKKEITLKDGTVKEREINGIILKDFPRIANPIKGTEYETTKYLDDAMLSLHNNDGRATFIQRIYSTDETVLRRLKFRNKSFRTIPEKILNLRSLAKIEKTYINGISKLHKQKDWRPNEIHGKFNQCVVPTGRLSSVAPNLQNFTPEIKNFIYSSYSTEDIENA